MKNTIHLLMLSILFCVCCSFKSPQQKDTSANPAPIVNPDEDFFGYLESLVENNINPIVEYNSYLESLLKKGAATHITLYEYRKGAEKLGYKSVSVSDEQIKKEIISNLFVDESLYKVKEDGSVDFYFSACMPDVTIIITDFSNDNEEFEITYYMEGCGPGEIVAPPLWSQCPLEKENAEQLNKIFKDLGLKIPINANP